ncbi:N-acetylneuraminate lyase B-like isoform X2 [Mya arenaria]|uniref:N-acetylneuraminate lyase B-like isoform X2 n=1 Tax=Mya arenaria TaxID=6604 RepID=UPI0022E32459|nr:N-acetylneuraminate lyase B-like isoform X2 [Mya arenaria]
MAHYNQVETTGATYLHIKTQDADRIWILKMADFRLHDQIAAPFTPLKEDGEINFDLLDKYADYMVNTHFKGIFVNGSLAEGMSMTIEERKQLADAWMKAAKGRLQVVVHVGANCIKDSQELARHAEQIGVAAIAAFSPSYYKPENIDVLVDVMAAVAGAAPKTPFYYYDINFCTGVYIDQREFMQAAKGRIPTLRGLKNSSRELPASHNCTFVEGCQVLIGSDNQYLSALALGIPGVVVASYLGNLFRDMRTAYQAGQVEKAREFQVVAQNINNIRVKYGGGINVAKAMFKIFSGLDAGSVRLPLRQLSVAEYEAMEKDFRAAGLVEIALPREQ